MKDIDPLPCPFCGAGPFGLIVQACVDPGCACAEGSSYMLCTACRTRGPHCPPGRDAAHARALWNTRDTATEEIARLMARRTVVRHGDT